MPCGLHLGLECLGGYHNPSMTSIQSLFVQAQPGIVPYLK